jgi:hypothetical protein
VRGVMGESIVYTEVLSERRVRVCEGIVYTEVLSDRKGG